MTPGPSPPPPPPTGAAGTTDAPPDESIRVLLSIGRSLALLFALLAALLFLVLTAFTLLDVVLGRGAGDLFLAVYSLVSAAVNFALWRELPRLEQLASARQYSALRDRLPVWAVLGLVFYVVVGALLLAAWLKTELLLNPRAS